MDRKLLDILVCPECKAPLVLVTTEGREELVCKADRLAYQVRDGVPVMLIDEARLMSDDEEIA